MFEANPFTLKAKYDTSRDLWVKVLKIPWVCPQGVPCPILSRTITYENILCIRRPLCATRLSRALILRRQNVVLRNDRIRICYDYRKHKRAHAKERHQSEAETLAMVMVVVSRNFKLVHLHLTTHATCTQSPYHHLRGVRTAPTIYALTFHKRLLAA